MSDSLVKLAKQAGIATVTLDNPSKINAFDDAIIQSLTEAFEQVDADPTIRVMVLAANGKHFSAGGDLAWMKRMANYSAEQNLADATKLANMLETLNFMRKPTIARVQGAAFGGAVGLVSCCDIAVASDNASFSLSEVKIGLIPATIAPYVIAALGPRAARRYFITGERFNAAQALQLGLVSKVCAEQDLDAEVQSFIDTLAANSPAAVSESKRLVADLSNQPIEQALIKDTCHRIAAIRVSDEGQEGLKAFLEKRKPAWITDQ